MGAEVEDESKSVRGFDGFIDGLKKRDEVHVCPLTSLCNFTGKSLQSPLEIF